MLLLFLVVAAAVGGGVDGVFGEEGEENCDCERKRDQEGSSSLLRHDFAPR